MGQVNHFFEALRSHKITALLLAPSLNAGIFWVIISPVLCWQV
jgi:hypothetical protein